ncbi:hypothetical protein EV421DRAFT_1742083 [Armillaria borealis]|uniref:Uncharacterized protein n=1 Tax=Armillaria borealis TaxID=47425 RepID=A0AA39IYG9_9AGAR|nr:hypothetical protein EV421DRAFT_1742083 [Armillaria borealis]
MTPAYLEQIFHGFRERFKTVFDNNNVDEFTGKGNDANKYQCTWQARNPIIFTHSLSYSNHAVATHQPSHTHAVATKQASDTVQRSFDCCLGTDALVPTQSSLDVTQPPLYTCSCGDVQTSYQINQIRPNHSISSTCAITMMALTYDIEISELPECLVYLWFLSRQDKYMALGTDYRENWVGTCVTEFLMDFPEWEPNSEQESAYMSVHDSQCQTEHSLTLSAFQFIQRIFDQLQMQELARHATSGIEREPSMEWPAIQTDTRCDSREWGGLDNPVCIQPPRNSRQFILANQINCDYSNFQQMPKGQKNKRPPFVYTDKQHWHLRKKAVFHAKAKKSGSLIVLQRFLDTFFVEWFLLFPEDSKLSGFELEAAQHFWKQVGNLSVWIHLGLTAVMH